MCPYALGSSLLAAIGVSINLMAIVVTSIPLVALSLGTIVRGIPMA
jgi:hypothetical protein